MVDPLDAKQIEDFLVNRPNWTYENDVLIGDYKFKDFNQAWVFLEKLAKLQEEHNHHAEIYNLYNKVTLKLTTHDAGNKVTKKDLDLVEALA